jgi:hypothetical protein
MSSELDRIKPVRFPTKWMTYKARIRRDVDRVYAAEGGPEYFDDEYVSRLGAQAKQLDEWLIKLFIVEVALTGFQVVGFIVSDASISLFGVTLKQAAGVKEVLLAFYCFVALTLWMVAVSRDTILAVSERLVELSTEQRLTNFGKLAAPTFFNMKFYFPSAHDDWIFPTLTNKIFFVIFCIVGLFVILANFLFSVAVNIFFFVDISRQPTLGTWSTLILAFVCLTVLFGFLFIVRFQLPLPYTDKSEALAIEALKECDPSLYRRQLAEMYGANSAYRRYKFSYVLKMRMSRIKDDAFVSACLAKWASLIARLNGWRRRKRLRKLSAE